jgi:beta-xylosidase
MNVFAHKTACAAKVLQPLCALCLIGSAPAEALFDGADPHVIAIGGSYWLYPTEPRSKEPIFAAYHSANLKEWKRENTILNLDDVPWVKANGAPRHVAWAPGMAEKNGRLYFYYSVGPQTDEHPSRIGVATGDSPAGPLKDSGAPLLTGGKGFEAIDPMVFTDPKGGKSYLYAGGSAGSRLRIFELEDDMVRLKREVEIQQPEHFTEGAFMHKRGETYYLSYSHGRWNDTSYSVHYCTAPSPTGPWKYQGAILRSDDSHQGPGHHSFVTDAAGNTFIVYHRWETTAKDGPFRGSRKIAIEKISYDGKGLILPVAMD